MLIMSISNKNLLWNSANKYTYRKFKSILIDS